MLLTTRWYFSPPIDSTNNHWIKHRLHESQYLGRFTELGSPELTDSAYSQHIHQKGEGTDGLGSLRGCFKNTEESFYASRLRNIRCKMREKPNSPRLGNKLILSPSLEPLMSVRQWIKAIPKTLLSSFRPCLDRKFCHLVLCHQPWENTMTMCCWETRDPCKCLGLLHVCTGKYRMAHTGMRSRQAVVAALYTHVAKGCNPLKGMSLCSSNPITTNTVTTEISV